MLAFVSLPFSGAHIAAGIFVGCLVSVILFFRGTPLWKCGIAYYATLVLWWLLGDILFGISNMFDKMPRY